MKCVNCRCVIPDTSPYCIYCGHVAYREDAQYPSGSPTTDQPNEIPSYQAWQENGVYHREADYDDPNRFYGIPEENDGSDAYDYYYDEIKYDERFNYPAEKQDRKGGMMLFRTDGFAGGASTVKWLCCLAALDAAIVLLLSIIMLLTML